MVAVIETDFKGCVLKVTSLGKRTGTDSDTASLEEAIRRQLELLEEDKKEGRRLVFDFNLVVNEVDLVLETTLKFSLRLLLAIAALNMLRIWVDAFGSRDISAIISCKEITLAELKVKFLEGLEAT